MTTAAAAELYLAQHRTETYGRPNAIHNPHDRPVNDLPVIYGFNNGGSSDWLSGVIMAEDGETLGGHICSNEGYMPADLGIIDGSRPDRHETFREKYPDGYRMEFVPAADVMTHPGLEEAYRLNQIRRVEAGAA